MATGIPLIDGPLWLLGLELGDGPALWDRGARSSGLQFAFTLDDARFPVRDENGGSVFDSIVNDGAGDGVRVALRRATAATRGSGMECSLRHPANGNPHADQG